jgi:hypothetical protein
VTAHPYGQRADRPYDGPTPYDQPDPRLVRGEMPPDLPPVDGWPGGQLPGGPGGVGVTPHVPIPPKPGEPGRRSVHLGAVVSQATHERETRRALVRQIAADPIAQQWLREQGAALLLAAAAELRRTHGGGGITGDYAAAIVERRAAEHERGETALW